MDTYSRCFSSDAVRGVQAASIPVAMTSSASRPALWNNRIILYLNAFCRLYKQVRRRWSRSAFFAFGARSAFFCMRPLVHLIPLDTVLPMYRSVCQLFVSCVRVPVCRGRDRRAEVRRPVFRSACRSPKPHSFHSFLRGSLLLLGAGPGDRCSPCRLS